MSDEKAEAQDQLQVALERHIAAFRSIESVDGMEVTGDWVLVAGVTAIDLETNDRRYAYHMAFSGGEQPEHIAIGLLEIGKALVSSGERAEE